MTDIRKAACVGGGVIGAGWAARYLWNGIDVDVYDPHPDSERRCREALEIAEASLTRLTGRRPARPGRVTFAAGLAEAVADADVVQESVPEDEAAKREVLAEIDAHAPARALIGSSTSGLLPSRLQADMAHPARFLVTHPFVPVYLLPLVELCGGERTDPDVVARARRLYRDIGMRPLVVRKEIDGFIADRLLEALWREALWLVHDDVATVEEVDDAVRLGPGLRWALMGSYQAYRIAGGEAGMRHFMAQFGPALQWPWTKLTDVPELSEAFIEKIAEQSDRQAAGRSPRDLARERDAGLIALLQALRSERLAAGEVLAGHEDAAVAPERGAADLDACAPLRLLTAEVPAAAVDYNGHMTESHYLKLFGDTGDALFNTLGLDGAALEAGQSFFTAESHLMHLEQVHGGDALAVDTQVLDADDKRIHAFHRMYRRSDDAVVATAEQMYLHVDTQRGTVCAAQGAIRRNMHRLAAAHASLPAPEDAGRAVGQPRPKAA